MQAQAYRVADGDLRGGAEDLAGGVGGDGVAAFEDAEGAAFLELEVEAVEALAFLAESAVGAGGELDLELLETQAHGCDLHSEIKSDDALVSDVETLRAQREIRAQRVSNA